MQKYILDYKDFLNENTDYPFFIGSEKAFTNKGFFKVFEKAILNSEKEMLKYKSIYDFNVVLYEYITYMKALVYPKIKWEEEAIKNKIMGEDRRSEGKQILSDYAIYNTYAVLGKSNSKKDFFKKAPFLNVLTNLKNDEEDPEDGDASNTKEVIKLKKEAIKKVYTLYDAWEFFITHNPNY